MKLRRLGRADIMITPIGLGCWQFSQGKTISGKFWPTLDQETIDEIVKVSLDNGINWFDTAEAYGKGQSEMALAEALKKAGVKPEKSMVATKWMPVARFASSILNTIDIRLKMLNPYPISLYQIHQPWSLSSVEGQMKAMAVLLRENKVKNVGVSNYNLERMHRAHEALKAEGFDLASNQVRYNLLDRRIEKNGVLDYAMEKNITIIAYSPLAQGLLTGKFHENPHLVKTSPGFRKFMPDFQKGKIQKSQPLIDELKKIAVKYKVAAAQVALNWVINFHGDTIVAIPGATSVKQAEQNTGAMKFSLSNDEMSRLDKISWEVIEA